MAVTITYRILLLAVIALVAILLLGVLLGLGILFIAAALLVKMSAKWRFALLVIGAILLLFALV